MTLRCFYSLVGVEPDAPAAELEAACEGLLDRTGSLDAVSQEQRTAAEILQSPTTRRMYDFLRRHADAEPPGNIARFRNDGERSLYAAYSGAWGFLIRDAVEDSACVIERAGENDDGPDRVPLVIFPRLPADGPTGDRPPELLTIRPRGPGRSAINESVEQPVFTPAVSRGRDRTQDSERRAEWPLEPVICGRHVYRISRHRGFIEAVYAIPGACHATCHVHGDRSITFEARYWHAAAFARGFKPGDEAVILSVFDPTVDEIGGTYAMITSCTSLWSFEPPDIYDIRWMSPNPLAYFCLGTKREEKLARYRYHFALRAASIEHAFDWTQETERRELVVATNSYVAVIHPSLKALCRPR